MKTPTTPSGLTRYDDLAPGQAAVRAWIEPGPVPQYHRACQEQVREVMPLLGRALDRAADAEANRPHIRSNRLLILTSYQWHCETCGKTGFAQYDSPDQATEAGETHDCVRND